MLTNNATKSRRELLFLVIEVAVIIFSVVSLLYNGIIRTLDIHIDFYVFYAAGQLWLEGKNPYDYNLYREQVTELAPLKAAATNTGFTYPPQTAALLSVYGHFPVDTIVLLVMAVNLLLLGLCFVLFIRLLSQHVPLGLKEIALLCILVFNTGFGRGNLRAGHLGILMCALIITEFLLPKGKFVFSGILSALLSLKPTFLPLFMGYFVLKKRFKTLLVCIIVLSLITVLPVIFTGRPVVETLTDWVHILSVQSRPGDVNDTDPFNPSSALLINLQPLVYRILNSSSSLATIVSWLMIFSVAGYCGLTLWKQKTKDRFDELYDLAIVSGVTLIFIYHRNYDVFLLFPALLYLYVYTIRLEYSRHKIVWGGFLVATLIVLSLPGDMLVQLGSQFPQLNDSYVWRVIAPFQTWFVLVTLILVVAINRQRSRQLVTKPINGVVP